MAADATVCYGNMHRVVHAVQGKAHVSSGAAPALDESAAQQQWLETLEKALRGWAAYLKAMLPRVMHLQCFERDWKRLMDVLKRLVAMEGLADDAGSRKVWQRLYALNFAHDARIYNSP
jgi:hypothetical protein